MFRALLLLLCSFFVLQAQPSLAPPRLGAAIQTLLDRPAARRALWSIHVRDLASGEVLYERNSQVPFTPASNTKLFSTALALTRLGPDFRFETRILAASAPDNGVVKGDLILVGGGDPSLSGRIYPYVRNKANPDPLAPLRELADQVALSGVKSIEGDIVGDDTRYPWEPYPDGWTVDDGLYDYGAPVSALTVNDSTQLIAIMPPRRNGDSATISVNPPVEYFTIQNYLRAPQGQPRRISIDRLPGSRVLTLSGDLPPGRGAVTRLVAVDDPAAYASTILRELLVEKGIAVRGSARARHRTPDEPYREPQGSLVARRLSPPLGELVQVINKVSQNLHAEIVFREAARGAGEDGSRQAALAALDGFLSTLGIAKDEHDFSDGSGLSRRTLVTSAAVTRLLQVMNESPQREVWRASLPVGGEDGTLAVRYKGVGDAARVAAKTGTLSHVSALSGYAGNVAFSVIVNHATAPASEYRDVLDKIALEILRKGNQ